MCFSFFFEDKIDKYITLRPTHTRTLRNTLNSSGDFGLFVSSAMVFHFEEMTIVIAIILAVEIVFSTIDDNLLWNLLL